MFCSKCFFPLLDICNFTYIFRMWASTNTYCLRCLDHQSTAINYFECWKLWNNKTTNGRLTCPKFFKRHFVLSNIHIWFVLLTIHKKNLSQIRWTKKNTLFEIPVCSKMKATGWLSFSGTISDEMFVIVFDFWCLLENISILKICSNLTVFCRSLFKSNFLIHNPEKKTIVFRIQSSKFQQWGWIG